MTADALETLRLAAAYRAACLAVQPAWDAMVASPIAATESPERAALRRHYIATTHAVSDAKAALLEHVRCGAGEVGR